MIYLLHGNNTYEMTHGLDALLAGLAKKYPGVVPERLDGGEVEPSDLPDMLRGTSLFGERRIIVLRDPSVHKVLWGALGDNSENVADTTDLIIVDAAVDRRTKTFKALQKTATVRDYPEFGPRSGAALTKWLVDEAGRKDLTLSRESADLLVERVGTDQWALSSALEKLSLVDDASPARIRDLIEPNPSASAFDLFETALRGDGARVRTMLADLRQTADPYALLGLLGSQAYNLALVSYSSKSPVELGRLTGSSAYPLQKLSPLARTLTKAKVIRAVEALAECDRDAKRSLAPPWTLAERALLKIAA